jgi:hypothetical protein
LARFWEDATEASLRLRVGGRRIGLGAATALALLPAASGGPLAAPACDASKIVLNRPDGYRERGERCEGVYAQLPVGGDLVAVVSFTDGRAAFDLRQGPIRLEWAPGAAPSGLRIRAVSLRRGLHYQMDTILPPGSASFTWPTDVLVMQQLQAGEIGVRGWSDEGLCGRRDLPLYVPLRLRQGDAAAAEGRPELLVVPGFDLRRLEAALERVDAEGRAAALGPPADLGRTSYPAGRPIVIRPPLPPEPGTYRIRLDLERRSDGLRFTDLVCFHHAGS